MPKPGHLIVVSGPSGVGKDTVLRSLFNMDPALAYSVSYTTRRPRPGEVDGRDYTFVSEAEFDRMIRDGELLEWANVHGHRSGTGRRRVQDAPPAGMHNGLNRRVEGRAGV